MTKFDRMQAILYVKYFEKELRKELSTDVELCLRISMSGDDFQNLLR